ncbi:MAG TPA: outer membrane beta-barrel protein [Gemmatimonadaceae bacterium]|nr:outer membrane beta-barrel protein [Gemmatimonadaceae bacterium]
MSTIGRYVAGIGLSLCAGAGLARAQTPSGEPPVRIGLGGGFSVPTSYADSTFKTGWHGQGFLLFNLGPLLHLGTAIPAIRLDVGYQHFGFKNPLAGAEAPQFAGSNAEAAATSTILSGLATLRLNLAQGGRIRPYLLAGLGAFHVAVDSAGGAGSASQTHFGIDGGGGIALDLGRVDFFVEGKVQNVYTDQGVINSKSIRYIPITFGLVF